MTTARTQTIASQLSRILFAKRRSSRMTRPLSSAVSPRRRVLAAPLTAPHVASERLATITITAYPMHLRKTAPHTLGPCHACGEAAAINALRIDFGTDHTLDRRFCIGCFGDTTYALTILAERFNLAVYNGDDFAVSDTVDDVNVVLDMSLFQILSQARHTRTSKTRARL